MAAFENAASGHRFNRTILRENDIRGVVGENLCEEDAYAVGRSFGTVVAEDSGSKVCLGFDGRLSSPALEAAAASGLADCGLDVVRIGRGPTPMLYFSVHELDAAGGLMVTGSHNPPNHNGFKMTLRGGPVHGDSIRRLGEIAASAAYACGNGGFETPDILDRYVGHLMDDLPAPRRKLSVVWDAGNGAAGEAMQKLAEGLPGRHLLLNETIDGTFPSHHPDPTVAANLVQLLETVLERKYELGIAFDGDGDRMGVVDGDGNILWGDQILMLLAEDMLSSHPGAAVIADVKSSQTLFDRIAELGGVPMMQPSGHSLIKAAMAETGALLAGEMSGHFFFADKHYGYDDALYAAVRLLSFLSTGLRSLSEIRAELPILCSTPELRIPCSDDRKTQAIDEIRRRLSAAGADFCDVDGVRVTTNDGWWLLRSSNTQAALVARCESPTKAGLERLLACVVEQLETCGVSVDGLSQFAVSESVIPA